MAEAMLLEVNRSSLGTPPPNCAICLGSSTNKCYSDSCKHEFCFACLVKWSKIKAECPLCKKPFKAIRHNLKSNEEYDEYVVENRGVINIDIDDHVMNHVINPFITLGDIPLRQFHFRTTFTADTVGENAIQEMLHGHVMANRISVSSYTLDRPPFSRIRGREHGFLQHLMNNIPTTMAMRRSLYEHNLWSFLPPNVCSGYFRDISPNYFRENGNARVRLVPWLNRELMALLGVNISLISLLVDEVLHFLTIYHVSSAQFREFCVNMLGSRADHFITELHNFMVSPLSMVEYDQNVIFMEHPTQPEVTITVSDYEDDSDVIIVGETTNENPEVIDLVDNSDDEPECIATEAPPPQEERPPILPIKLRLKNKHEWTCKQRLCSPSSSSSNEDNDVVEERSYRKYKRRRRELRKEKERNKKRVKVQEEANITINETATSYAKDKYKKHSRRKQKHRNHTITSRDLEDGHSTQPLNLSKLSVSEALPNPPTWNYAPLNYYSSPCIPHYISPSIGFEAQNAQTSCSYPFYVASNFQQANASPSDNQMKTKDKRASEQHPSTSGGRVRNLIIKKEESTNLWYSRPLPCGSDSSDSD